MDKILTLLKLAVDLHLGQGDGVDQITKLNSWLATGDGIKVVQDLNQLLVESGVHFQIALPRKP